MKKCIKENKNWKRKFVYNKLYKVKNSFFFSPSLFLFIISFICKSFKEEIELILSCLKRNLLHFESSGKRVRMAEKILLYLSQTVTENFIFPFYKVGQCSWLLL